MATFHCRWRHAGQPTPLGPGAGPGSDMSYAEFLAWERRGKAADAPPIIHAPPPVCPASPRLGCGYGYGYVWVFCGSCVGSSLALAAVWRRCSTLPLSPAPQAGPQHHLSVQDAREEEGDTASYDDPLNMAEALARAGDQAPVPSNVSRCVIDCASIASSWLASRASKGRTRARREETGIRPSTLGQ
jgi:hypothetical protein